MFFPFAKKIVISSACSKHNSPKCDRKKNVHGHTNTHIPTHPGSQHPHTATNQPKYILQNVKARIHLPVYILMTPIKSMRSVGANNQKFSRTRRLELVWLHACIPVLLLSPTPARVTRAHPNHPMFDSTKLPFAFLCMHYKYVIIGPVHAVAAAAAASKINISGKPKREAWLKSLPVLTNNTHIHKNTRNNHKNERGECVAQPSKYRTYEPMRLQWKCVSNGLVPVKEWKKKKNKWRKTPYNYSWVLLRCDRQCRTGEFQGCFQWDFDPFNVRSSVVIISC